MSSVKTGWYQALRTHGLNTSRHYVDQFAQRAGRSTAPGARILDAGSGIGQYRSLFSHAKYESADFCQVDKEYAQVDYVCDLRQIPVEADRYDEILFTQVLEHLAEPGAVLKELNRVCRPGGRIWLSAPLFYPEHEVPHDYFRYTQFGLKSLLSSADFEITDLEWTEGYLGTLSYQLNYARRQMPVSPSAYGGGLIGVLFAVSAVLVRPLFRALAVMTAVADYRHRHVSSGQCVNYCVVAKKIVK